MPFVPKLPTFHEEVCEFSIFNPASEEWGTSWGLQDGQVYTPLRGPDDEFGGSLYLMIRKTDNALQSWTDIDGPWNANDAYRHTVRIHVPSGSTAWYYYSVEEILPRWHRFPNEHLICILRLLDQAEIETRYPDGTDPAPDFMYMGFLPPVDNSCSDCETFQGPFSLPLISDDGDEVLWRISAPFACAESPDTDVILGINYVRSTGLVNVTLNNEADTSTLVQWQDTVLDWDFETNLDIPLVADIWGACDFGDALILWELP